MKVYTVKGIIELSKSYGKEISYKKIWFDIEQKRFVSSIEVITREKNTPHLFSKKDVDWYLTYRGVNSTIVTTPEVKEMAKGIVSPSRLRQDIESGVLREVYPDDRPKGGTRHFRGEEVKKYLDKFCTAKKT